MPTEPRKPDEVEETSETSVGEPQHMPEGLAAAVELPPPDYNAMQEMVSTNRKAAGPILQEEVHHRAMADGEDADATVAATEPMED